MVEKFKKGVRILALTLGWILAVPVFLYFLPVFLFHWMMNPAEYEPEWRAYKWEKRLKRQQWRAELLQKRRRLVDLGGEKKAFSSTVRAGRWKKCKKILRAQKRCYKPVKPLFPDF